MSRKLIASIRVPWTNDPDGLGKMYQEEVERCVGEFVWVPFMDHDAMILTRDWNRRLVLATRLHPEAGLITCRVNMQWRGQKSQSLGVGADVNMAGMISVAEKRAAKCGDLMTTISSDVPDLISGVFFMVHADRFLEICPLPRGFYGIDNVIHRELDKAGHPAVVIEGMVAWHRYKHVEKRRGREKFLRAYPDNIPKPS